MRIWPTAGGAIQHEFEIGQYYESLAFSADRTRLLVGGDAGQAQLWNMDGVPLESYDVIPMVGAYDPGGVNGVAFSPDGGRVLTVAYNGKGYIWPAGGGPVLAMLDVSDHILSSQFSPDGRLLLITGADSAARLWSIERGTLLATFQPGRSAVYSTVFSADGDRVLTGGEDGAVRVWDIPRIVREPAVEQVRIACEAVRLSGIVRITDADRQRVPTLAGARSKICPQ